MNFDPKGTAPGLNPEAKPEPKVHHIKCRAGSCPSVKAIEITTESPSEGAGASHMRLYQCTVCKHTWALGVGGNVNI